jgi:hypothetical protein
VTEFFYNEVEGFRLNGKYQSVRYNKDECSETINIYDKTIFSHGKIVGHSCAMHLFEYSWRKGYSADLKPWEKFILLRISVFNYISNQLHKQAKRVLEQDGELQRIYRETIKNDNR